MKCQGYQAFEEVFCGKAWAAAVVETGWQSRRDWSLLNFHQKLVNPAWNMKLLLAAKPYEESTHRGGNFKLSRMATHMPAPFKIQADRNLQILITICTILRPPDAPLSERMT